MAKISYILLKNPVVIPTGTTLLEAVKLMQKHKISSLIVSRDCKLAGIVSVDDVIRIVAARADMDINVEEVMHTPSLTIDSDKWLFDVISIFEKNNVSHLTVIENGEKVGIIRADDVLHTYRFENIMKENHEMI